MPAKDDLVIDPEFEGLLDPLSDEEYAVLEKKVIAEGMTEPVKVWKGHRIVVDGHHRLRACRAHSIPYEVEELPFDSWEAVVEWILRNQYGRRNASPVRRRYHLGILYELEKGKPGVAAGGAADAKVGKKVGASAKTVRRAAKFKAAVDKLPDETKKAVLSGKVKAKAVITREAPAKPKRKQGAARFAWGEAARELGKAARVADRVREVYGDKLKDDEHEAMVTSARDLVAVFEKARKRLAK